MSRRLRFKRNLGRPDVTPTARREELRYVRFEHASEVVLGVRYGPFSYLSDAREVLVAGGDVIAGDDEQVRRVVAGLDESLEEHGCSLPCAGRAVCACVTGAREGWGP